MTGTPGCGKTSILEVLRDQGFAVVPEAATDVIAAEQARGIDEPWTRPEFVDQITALQRARQLEAAREEPGADQRGADQRSAAQRGAACEEPGADEGGAGQRSAAQRGADQRGADHRSAGVLIYDRSPVCTLALARYLDRPVTPLLAGEIKRLMDQGIFQRPVFFVRPIGFIEPTPARRISYPESLMFERLHEEAYREHGFELIDVPPGSIEARAALVARHLAVR